MKKIIIICILFIFITIGVAFIPSKEINYDYLRLHIRANSNSVIDQDVKYEIKDKLIEFLTPHFCTVESKKTAIKIVENYSNVRKSLCEN